MYCFSKTSKRKLYHTEGCKYINNIAESNLGACNNQQVLFNNGYTFCEYCSPAGKYLRANSNYINELSKKTQKKVQRYNIRYNNGRIEITSAESKYLLVFKKGRKMCLYHANAFDCATYTEIPGYHLQMERDWKLSKLMKYIIQHDGYRKCFPIYYDTKEAENKKTVDLLNALPSECFKVSDEKSERMKHIESYNSQRNITKPLKSGVKGKKHYRRVKKQKAKELNDNNVDRVEMLLMSLSTQTA